MGDLRAAGPKMGDLMSFEIPFRSNSKYACILPAHYSYQ